MGKVTPGHASKLAAQPKEAAAAIPEYGVLTDLMAACLGQA